MGGRRSSGARLVVFSLTVALVPALALAWVRLVGLEMFSTGLPPLVAARRTALLALAAVAGYAVLRLAGLVVVVLAAGLDRATGEGRG